MDCIRKKVKEEMVRGWIGSNRGCSYHPTHFEGQDCTFCYCPFFPCNDADLGRDVETSRGTKVWSCTDCLFIHRTPVVKFILSEMERMGIEDPCDPRIDGILPEAKCRFMKTGKAIMILGATSDAGKSVTAMAVCRMLCRRGVVTAPFKSQNMSLNSKVTMDGCEIAMIQALQCKAAGVKNPDTHMNPILLKPKGDMVSQVMVEGRPYGDYDVEHYYSEFVPGPGEDIVRRNIDFLKSRYDVVVMEGAGSPAEINIYDRDIANMRAARIADADCILVVNVEWGGSFAYALGTVELLEPEDRKRIKGIILNNVRGDPESFRSGADELERMCGVPVIGIVPHADVKLPSEDSEAFRDTDRVGCGRIKVAVIKLPRIANFTDIDPLSLEDTTVVFVSRPEELAGCDAVVIPGTKNTVDDMMWMRSCGMADAIVALRGKVPILGICGGYQMMGRVLRDPNGLEGSHSGDTPGLGLFDMESSWGDYTKCVRQDSAVMISTGEEVEGYEIHMGNSDTKEERLFRVENICEKFDEGSVREDEMLYGSYLHGLLDKPAFRRHFLSKAAGGHEPADVPDYGETLEQSIDKLTDVFEANMDVDSILKMAGVVR
jgi:adenosylcobyric acid synthase